MTCQVIVFFENPAIRKQFLHDIDGLILHHDSENREEHDRMNYEDTLSFCMPDLDQEGDDPHVNPWSRKNFASALKAINSSASAC